MTPRFFLLILTCENGVNIVANLNKNTYHTVHCLASSFITTYPAHNKTYNKTCVTSKVSDQPVHLPNKARILSYPTLDGLEAVEGACDQ